MKISSIPAGFKATTRYSRPAHIKADTHHLYTTEKYVVEIVYHSSMFYAPEFYKVSVKSKAGEEIWNGGDVMFLDSLFRSDFVSDAYDLTILTRVNSTESPNHMQIILVDLKTGKEKVLTEEGNYHLAGHFLSFNCIYYSDSKGTHCMDCNDNSLFMLNDVLNSRFTEIQAWGICPVKDSMIVITREQEKNVCLFNLIQQQIVDSSTFHWGKADSVNVIIGYAMQPSITLISVSYSDRQPNGVLKHTGTENFMLEFEYT